MKFHWLIPIPFILIGVGLIIYQVKVKKKIFAYKSIFGFVFVGFALLWGIMVGKSQIFNYNTVRTIIEEKSYQTVTGKVENFVPMPEFGHKHESFDVNGIRFEYSDFEIIESFNNTCSHGGPICNNGQEVVINYRKKGDTNFILKLKIKLMPTMAKNHRPNQTVPNLLSRNVGKHMIEQ